MASITKSRRQERVENQKKNSRKWIATGAAAVILLCGGAIVYNNVTGDNQPSTSSQAVPAACSTTQTVTVATTEPMAEALKTMPVDEETCITLDITTDKTASDIVTESASGTASTNLWIPDSTARAELAMGEAGTGLTPLAESLAQTPGVIVSENKTSYDTWLEALHAEETVSMGDPKEDPGAFAALLAGISEASAGTVSVEDLIGGTALRAQSIGVIEAAQSAPELLADVDNGTKDAVIVTEADYAAYAAAHSDSGLTATVPGDGSFTLNYPLYQASSSTNATIDDAAQQIIDFMASEEGKQALASAGLRPADGQELEGQYSAGSFTSLTPSNQDILTQVWTSYSLQSAPLHALVVLDTSGSMLTPEPGSDKTRMDITVESVLAGSQLFPARDSMGLWKFSRDLTLPDGTVSDYQELLPVRGLEETVDGKTQRELIQEAGAGIASTVNPHGFTALYDTTLAAFRSAKENYDYGSVNAVIMLTDGKNFDETSISEEELIAALQAEQDPENPVFIIMIGISEEADMEALTSIAQSVGGEAYQATSPTDVQRIFAEALTGISEAAAQQ
ncbi:MAG: substrate-binding domain-containing protein [Rothia sp. (in: high G+C Gram-positive bacteria)]|nr:substrate-binding domain-containing protein [Rothia sp. (in: high G+C Gram-positive bacteria)]